MPPLQALVALHGLWLLALLPPVAWAIRRWSPLQLRLVGMALTGLGVLGIGMVAGREVLTWLPVAGTENRRYVVQRVLFVLATLPDVPLVQVTVAGLTCWIIGKRRGAARMTIPPTKAPDSTV